MNFDPEPNHPTASNAASTLQAKISRFAWTPALMGEEAASFLGEGVDVANGSVRIRPWLLSR
jgi:hypothetical protein